MNEVCPAPPNVCAACAGRYPGDASFCPVDGTPLRSQAAPRDVADPYIGREISGHIEIRQLVGVGAMGRVYRAFQRGVDRDVAVKILHRELSANAQLVARFTREAKVASRLQHPNVVSVLLTGQLPDGALYIVMEFLDGLSLRSALGVAGGALPLTRALHIALQLCDASGEGHAQGIVHRDLKPDNVMLVRRGEDPDCVKVLDFGIARIESGEPSSATAAGLVFGTARYISPEGAQGGAVGPASDVYSIATLLYQMLAGRTPFEGEQAVALLLQHIHDTPPPLRSIPRAAYVPEPIAELVMTNLSKDPNRREQEARAFGHALLDVAKISGLSLDDISRPILRRSGPVQRPPVERTNPLEVSPELAARLSPTDPRISSADVTLDDASAEPPPVAPSGALRVEPTRTAIDAPVSGSRTLPADASKTEYSAPVPLAVRLASDLEPISAPLQGPPRRRASRGLALVLLCFVLGAAIAAGVAHKLGKLGGQSSEEQRFVARAVDAMNANRWSEPPGDNVRDITDEGLRRWPGSGRFIDVRGRAADALVSRARSSRGRGDVAEALRIAQLALELDPREASARRLVEQYEREVTTFSIPPAPPLDRPPAPLAPANGRALRASRSAPAPAPAAGRTAPAGGAAPPGRRTAAPASPVSTSASPASASSPPASASSPPTSASSPPAPSPSVPPAPTTSVKWM